MRKKDKKLKYLPVPSHFLHRWNIYSYVLNLLFCFCCFPNSTWRLRDVGLWLVCNISSLPFLPPHTFPLALAWVLPTHYSPLGWVLSIMGSLNGLQLLSEICSRMGSSQTTVWLFLPVWSSPGIGGKHLLHFGLLENIYTSLLCLLLLLPCCS